MTHVKSEERRTGRMLWTGAALAAALGLGLAGCERQQSPGSNAGTQSPSAAAQPAEGTAAGTAAQDMAAGGTAPADAGSAGGADMAAAGTTAQGAATAAAGDAATQGQAGGDGAQVAGTLERPVPPSQDAPSAPAGGDASQQ